VLTVAKDLRNLAREFIEHIDDSASQELAWTALQNALGEGQKAADHYHIANPLAL